MSEIARDATPIEGRCLCGAVTIRVDGEHDTAASVCHCEICRRWSGGVFATTDAAAEAVSVTGEVRAFRSSDVAERAFCPTCGSHLWFRALGAGADYELMPGLFPAAADYPLAKEIYTDEAPRWARLAGDHDRETRAEWIARNPSMEGVKP